MNGFQSPNYTQTPNDLFDELLPEMGLAELKVVLCIVRHTFGYHRDEIKLSIRKIARFTGLNVNSVMDGAKQAEDHGLIERQIDGNKTTVWSAVVRVLPAQTRRLNSSDASVLPDKTQVGVKEKKEKNKENAATPRLSETEKAIQDLSIENQIFLGKMNVTHSRVDEIKNALRQYFRLTPRWASKFEKQWLEWAVDESMTAYQIRAAAEVWGGDRRFNWQPPSLKGIADHWLELKGDDVVQMSPLQQALADLQKASANV